MGAKVIIFDKILNSTFLKGLCHSAVYKPVYQKGIVQYMEIVVEGAQFEALCTANMLSM